MDNPYDYTRNRNDSVYNAVAGNKNNPGIKEEYDLNRVFISAVILIIAWMI